MVEAERILGVLIPVLILYQETLMSTGITPVEECAYDPNDPLNIEDRMNDPDDGIDYDAIIMETEADIRAGRTGWRFESMEEFRVWLHEIFVKVEAEVAAERAAEAAAELAAGRRG